MSGRKEKKKFFKCQVEQNNKQVSTTSFIFLRFIFWQSHEGTNLKV